MGKGENADYQHFLFFQQYLYSIKERNRHFGNIEFFRLHKNYAFNLVMSTILSFGKSLTHYQTTNFRRF